MKTEKSQLTILTAAFGFIAGVIGTGILLYVFLFDLGTVSPKYLNNGYQKTESTCAVLYYTAQDEKNTSMLLLGASTYLPMLKNQFEIECPKPVIIIHPSRAAFNAALDGKLREAATGAYYRGIIHILSPQLWISAKNDIQLHKTFMKYGPLIHEMTHYIIDLKSDGHAPAWFSEGAALYCEYKYTACEWHSELKSAAAQIPMSALQHDFYAIDTNLAYRKSLDAVLALADKHGESILNGLCEYFRS